MSSALNNPGNRVINYRMTAQLLSVGEIEVDRDRRFITLTYKYNRNNCDQVFHHRLRAPNGCLVLLKASLEKCIGGHIDIGFEHFDNIDNKFWLRKVTIFEFLPLKEAQ